MLKDFRENRYVKDETDFIDVDALLAIARRQWRVVVVCAGFFLVLGVVYILTAVPLFTATTRLMIDTGNQKIVSELSAVEGVTADDASILSQVELLKSEKIARAVVEKKNLVSNPIFQADGKSLIGSVKNTIRAIIDVSSWFSSNEEKIDVEMQKRLAAAKIVANLGVSRVDRTYVLELSYTSASPELAAQIAHALAEAYLVDQLNSKYEATRRASDWLQERIEELRQKSLATDLAVQRFKAEKGLIATGGELITDQQLSQLNSQLIVSQAEAAEAEAKYTRIRNIIDSGQMDAAVTESLNSSVINGLREKFLDASRREADIASRLGEKHAQVIRLKNEMKEYRRLIFEELARIAESYQSNLEVARKNQLNLEQQVAQATGVSVTANDAQVQLRELERESETYKNLYQTFLERYQEAVQQQSFPVNEARVISDAEIPTDPSFPRKSLVLAISFILGCAAGGGIGALREFRERFFRLGEQIRSELDLEFLGNIPLKDKSAKVVNLNGAEGEAARLVHRHDLSDYAVRHPLSPFAETLRSSHLAVDLSSTANRARVVGVVSSVPGEGKSTVAVNFAELLASQGNRTLLIDGDLRNPGATRALTLNAKVGLLEAILGETDVVNTIITDPTTKLDFIPAVIHRRVSHSSELLASSGMADILKEAADAYDYVVIDLPPLGPVVDARAMANKVDAFIYVVEWGKTARQMVKSILSDNPRIANKCAGVILNKVDTKALKFYQRYGSNEYYYSRYASYYTTE